MPASLVNHHQNAEYDRLYLYDFFKIIELFSSTSLRRKILWQDHDTVIDHSGQPDLPVITCIIALGWQDREPRTFLDECTIPAAGSFFRPDGPWWEIIRRVCLKLMTGSMDYPDCFPLIGKIQLPEREVFFDRHGWYENECPFPNAELTCRGFTKGKLSFRTMRLVMC